MKRFVYFVIVIAMIFSMNINVMAIEQNNATDNENNNVNQDVMEEQQNKNFKVSEEEKSEQTELEDGDNSELIEDVVDNSDDSVVEPILTYSTHVQNKGWMNYVNTGEISGAIGQQKRIEAIKINLSLGTLNGNIVYSSHVQCKGWTDYVSNGEVSGTEGQSKQLEAIKIQLTGEIANTYDIYYRVYVQNNGWLDWTCNGNAAGSQTYGYRLEAIEIKLVKKGDTVPSNTENPFLIPGNVYYSTHMQNTGWLANVGDGKTSGAINQNKRMEAVKISLDETKFNGNIMYSTHIQEIGWLDYVKDGMISGTEGRSKRLEAIKIKLIGEIANYYDVYYRAYIQNFGWLDWAKNDEIAGSEGFSYRIEGLEIMLVEKGNAAPGNTSKPCLKLGNVNYQAHLQNTGWVNTSSNGATCGAIGQSKRMEALRISLGENRISGNIEYSSHVQNIGWMDYVSNGEISGTEGQSKRIEAIKIRLSGDIANYYDVYYRVYAQSFGWLGWTCNDRVAGTTNGSFRLEAIQIKLYPKNTGPGVDKKSVINFVADGNYKVCQDAFGNKYTDAESFLGKRSGYTVFTNLSTNIVNVFIADGEGREIITYKRYQCTSGAPSTPTIKGTYYIYMKRYYFDSGSSRCFYFSPFKGGYGFHSVLYYQDSTPQRIRDGRLGMYLSHGCIRLAINNAKWIYDNCPTGTKVINL